MSRIAKLYPTRIYRTQYNTTVENESNMFTGVDSDTYASVTNSGKYLDALFLGGFDFSLVPSNAIITTFSIRVRLGADGASLQTTGYFIYNGTTRQTSVANYSRIYIYENPIVSTIEYAPLSFENLRSFGDAFNLGIPAKSNGTTRVYGVEIDVEYDLPKNKVVYFGQTLIDLTADTVTAERLTKGFTAHDASGALITGVATEGSTYQDEDDCVVLGENESSAPQGNISITANGTYDVADYAGATVAVPVGMTETQLRAYIERSSSFTSIDWPDGITRIGRYAFAGCNGFNPSSLPDGVTSIETYAFYSTNLSSLTELPSGLKTIGTYAFFGTNLALTSLPDTVTTISDYAFRNCTKLALTSLPSSLSGTIGSFAFGADDKITLSVIPSGVTKIASYAFSNCSGIQSISCDGAITSLETCAFTGGSARPMYLASASFPNMALTSNLVGAFGSMTAANACQQLAFCDIGLTAGIAANAFANCYALETLVLRKTASVCTLANVSAFLNTPMRGYNSLTGKVYVPSALIESYKTATNWSTLYNAGTVEFLAIEGSEYER